MTTADVRAFEKGCPQVERDLHTTTLGILTESPTTDNESQLWVMAAIAFVISYSNSMFTPLIPALSREFSVPAYQLGWLIPGYLILYGISTLVYGAFSDWWGRAPTLVALLCFSESNSASASTHPTGVC